MSLKNNLRGTKEMRELAVALIILIHWGINASKQGLNQLLSNISALVMNWQAFTEGFKGIAEVDDELFDLTPEEAAEEQLFIAGKVGHLFTYAKEKSKAIAVQTYVIVTEVGVLVNMIKTSEEGFKNRESL